MKLRCLLSAATVAAMSLSAPAQRWDPEIVDLFARIPVQDGGRIKPLASLAGFTLLGMHGKRKLTTPAEETIGPEVWLLDTMFAPDDARRYALFKVADSETIEAIGVNTAGKRKTDRYSYDELLPGIDNLFSLASQFQRKESDQRTRIEGQIVNLATNVNIFQHLLGYMQFARHHFELGTEPLRELFGGREVVHFSDLLEKGPELVRLWESLRSADAGDPHREALDRLLGEMEQLASFSRYLALFPPDGPPESNPKWYTVEDVARLSLGGIVVPRHVDRIRGFERLADAPDIRTFRERLAPLSAALVQDAERRAEYGTIGLEVTYYRLQLTSWSQYLFLLGFALVLLSWLLPRTRLLYHGGWVVTLGANAALIAAITMRCIIRARPPVSTLYETLLFITAVLVLVALIVEWVVPRRIAASVGTILGVIGMFLANRFEGLRGVPEDTMPVLQAVLDTNFWLATHVTAITIGYAAGMLAAGFGSFYLLAKVFGWKKGNKRVYHLVARMTYGVVCFGLLFSVVGTILGGIWANDSWGRFWGWDPKENGALLICLMNLVIIHGRMGGFLKDHGVCAAAAFGGTVVAFSWFHVNQLGVGLHSYGFTEGVLTALGWYYFTQWGIIAAGFVPWQLARHAARVRSEMQAATDKASNAAEGATT